MQWFKLECNTLSGDNWHCENGKFVGENSPWDIAWVEPVGRSGVKIGYVQIVACTVSSNWREFCLREEKKNP